MLVNQKGQTSVEYILMIAAITIVLSSVLGNLRERLVENPDSFLNSYIAELSSLFDGGDYNGAYKRFVIKR